MSLEQFKNLFRFDAEKAGCVGVERECFVTNFGGVMPVPEAQLVLGLLPQETFGFELSACQVESRTEPCRLSELGTHLRRQEHQLQMALRTLGLSSRHCEVGPELMPLDVYPDPTGRYQVITKDMPRDVLLAACRVIGTHVHVGMRDHESALRTYNYVHEHCQELCELGNGSFGERLAIYRQMAPNYLPPRYADWQEYYDTACAQGFSQDPRKCWTLIRISVHGTIEFRMFGATDSIPRIVGWAQRCYELCQEALSPA